MSGRGNPQVLKHVVVFLRDRARMTQEKFARAAGTTQAKVSAYEQGTIAPPDDTLRRMAQAANFQWHIVLHLIHFLGDRVATCRILLQESNVRRSPAWTSSARPQGRSRPPWSSPGR